jgi:hypothetical protein
MVFLPESRVPLETPIKVIDSRNKKELSFYESGQINPKHRNAGRFIHIAINDAPAIGVVRVDILEGSKSKESKGELKNELVLENEFLKVTLDPKTSSVSSIYSKSLKKDSRFLFTVLSMECAHRVVYLSQPLVIKFFLHPLLF